MCSIHTKLISFLSKLLWTASFTTIDVHEVGVIRENRSNNTTPLKDEKNDDRSIQKQVE